MTSEAEGYKLSILDEHEHTFVTAIETSPTCTRGGSQILTCSICNYNYIEILEPLGHAEGEWDITEGSCTEGGVRIKKCTRCSYLL